MLMEAGHIVHIGRGAALPPAGQRAVLPEKQDNL